MIKVLWVVLGVFVLMPFVHAEEVQTLAGFSVPEYDKNGNMTSQLFGDFAEFLPGGKVKISNLKIEFYDGKKVEMRVTAPRCDYDQKDKSAESDSSVRIARDNMIVTGVGFRWNAKKEKLYIDSKAKVVLKNVHDQVDLGETP